MLLFHVDEDVTSEEFGLHIPYFYITKQFTD